MCRVYVDVYVGDCIMLTEFVMYLYVPTWCEINVIIIIISKYAAVAREKSAAPFAADICNNI